MKNMSRALRRHHAQRLKRSRRFYQVVFSVADPRQLGQLLHTPARCSCWLCGNARLHHGRTPAEQVHRVQLVEQLADVFDAGV